MREGVVRFGCDGVGELLVGQVGLQGRGMRGGRAGLRIRRARERICRPMSVAMVTNTSEATVAVMMTVGSSTSITIGEPESPPVCG